ncbi:MAG: M12 family metallo-peptidase [Flavobacteriaceae bacterium]|nr:M12 family metallo-peptidase [Flavobacteriaceae bacterium]
MGISLYGQGEYWRPISQGKQATSTASAKQEGGVHYYQLLEEAFARQLQIAQLGSQSKSIHKIYFPHPQYGMQAFAISPNQIMDVGLQKKYPKIQVFKGKTANSQQQIYFSFSPKGLSATYIDKTSGSFYFYQKENNLRYAVYRRKDRKLPVSERLLCRLQVANSLNAADSSGESDGQLRTYRLAVAASGEYTAYHGGTKADALAAITASITRINAILELELSVRLVLIANNDDIIYINSATDPFSSNLNRESQATIDKEIGDANYDIGHLFHSGSGNNDGNSGFLGSVCITGQKGSAYVRHQQPEGDLFDIDFVLHEMGHQFGANHTWSYAEESTGVQVEPGSGSTIMGYAGIANLNNVQSQSDPYFHQQSLVQMQTFIAQSSCGQTTALPNNKPEISPLESLVIPPNTAFVLEATATDTDGDALTYCWEQIDDGVVTNFSFGPNHITGANFRSLLPSSNNQRYFPKMELVRDGKLINTNPTNNSPWETLSTVARDMNFAITVRDNNSAGGQWHYRTQRIRVDDSGTAFAITSQQTKETWLGSSIQTIEWEVGKTAIAPIGVSEVDILLSTDGGRSYPILLASQVPNTGSYKIQSPNNITSSTARIMVRARDHIFFAVNPADITLEADTIDMQLDAVQINQCRDNNIQVDFDFGRFNGFTEAVSFSASNLPSGVTANFTPASIDADSGTIQLKLDNWTGLEAGLYEIEINANTNSQIKSVPLQIQLYQNNLNTPIPTSPDIGDTVFLLPIFEWDLQPQAIDYTLDLATDNSFTNMVYSHTTTSNSFKSPKLEAASTYYWRVRANNPCGSSPYSATRNFTSSVINCRTTTGLGLPKNIPSSGTPTVETLVVFQEDLPIVSLRPTVELQHSFLGDLSIWLQSPQGTKVLLYNGICGDKQNMNAIFDPRGSTPTCSGDPAVSGSIRPIGDLDLFVGESIHGSWKLIVEDGSNFDGGAISNFSLEVCVGGQFALDADQDGVLDTVDQCPNTPPNSLVDVNGCKLFKLKPDNFSIQSISERCRDSKDGKIHIGAKQTLNYTATLYNSAGEQLQQKNFINSNQFEGLDAGNYRLCLIGSNGTDIYETVCYDIIVEEPDALQAAFAYTQDQVIVQLQGAQSYEIEWNGSYQSTQENQLVLELTNGVNVLKVKTDKSCQGEVIKYLIHESEPIVYHDIASQDTKLLLGFDSKKSYRYSIYDMGGNLVSPPRLISRGEHAISLHTQRLSKGVYLLKIEAGQKTRIQKIIKP